MTEPKQTSERRATIEDALARLPQVVVAFKTVPGNTPEFYALQVLGSALTGGQSSRLFQKLVKEKELVTGISSAINEVRGTGAFTLTATVRPGKNPADVEAAIYEEIERLKATAIADWELQKAKSNTRRSFINGLQSSLNRSINLGIYATFYNDPNLINTRLDRVNAVKAEDVRRVAEQFLQPTNRTVVVTMPKPKTATAAAGAIQKDDKEVAR